MEGTLENIISQKSLQWIFVGGKGGVGKTTVSCSLAIQLAKVRKSVLIVSTDPAHNIGDAFAQKFTKNPLLVNGYDNLYAMEVDPIKSSDEVVGGPAQDIIDNNVDTSMMSDLFGSLPGLDELTSFTEMMKLIHASDVDVVVFDTAPTGHTLRLLSYPSMWEKLLGRLSLLKHKFLGMLSQFGSMFGLTDDNSPDNLLQKLDQIGKIISDVNAQFQNPEKTTFVCVCIAEFLSLYETERLVQELTEFNIDVHNIVVNQLIPSSSAINCHTCQARLKMQKKYLQQISELYEEDDLFHVVKLPLMDSEVRGKAALDQFSEKLLNPNNLDTTSSSSSSSQ